MEEVAEEGEKPSVTPLRDLGFGLESGIHPSGFLHITTTTQASTRVDHIWNKHISRVSPAATTSTRLEPGFYSVEDIFR